MPNHDDGDMTADWLEQATRLTLEEYFELDEAIARNVELVDGVIVLREKRGRPHQKTAFRLASALEAAAQKHRLSHSGKSPPCCEVNTEVDVLLFEVPPLSRKPDAVLHHCRDQFETIEARDAVIVAEVISPWSVTRDRIHKMGEYAKSGIPHYLIVQFDEIGATIVEHYALLEPGQSYSEISINHRDRDIWALNMTTPFVIQAPWQALEVGPPA